jgi:hypothetical protein
MRHTRNGHARPAGAISIHTYRQLEAYISAFASEHINLLILVGAPGLAKTRTVRRVLGKQACWIEGNATPFGMYMKLYRYRDQFVVIDDVDSLYADKNGIRLLKCLCQTEEEKNVAWHSAARSLEREGIPREFVTQSRVVIICNDWKTLNRNVVALQDRGHTLLFEPTSAEVHRKTGEWFDDQVVFRWFEENLRLVTEPSMRLYLRAAELKRAGMDWMQIMPISPEDPRERLVAELQADGEFGRAPGGRGVCDAGGKGEGIYDAWRRMPGHLLQSRPEVETERNRQRPQRQGTTGRGR